jgi:CBS domain-containing protein
MDKPVSSLMTTPVRTVSASDTIEAVEEEMTRHDLSFVPVVEGSGGAVLGVISASDLLQFQRAGRDPKSVQAWEICTYKPIEVSPDTAIAEAARQMVARKIHHVIVMQDQEVVGVVSSLDFVRQFSS